MKKWNRLYETLKLPIRVMFFGFLLIAIGSLILNENVNIFYTFTNHFILSFAKLSIYTGRAIISMMPLIFIVNLVAKKANSGTPMILALVGYVTYMVVTMIFAQNMNLPSQAYVNNLGISFSVGNINYYPLQTGFVGSFIVAYIARYAFIRSRNRSSYSILGFINKDSAALIYVVILCGVMGFLTTLLYPLFIGAIQEVILYVSKDLSDPLRMSLYGIADRVMSILGMGGFIREPFWYGAQGGSYMTVAGQTILGDVNIWKFYQDSALSYSGCGRFITPYYVINMFVVPAIYLGMFTSMSDRKEKRRCFLFLFGAVVLSICAGNPLPLELVMLFTSPLLLIFYLIVVMIIFYVLPHYGAFLGFAYSGPTNFALPGSFPDYIIQLRNPELFDTVVKIFIVGMIAFVICFIITRIYYRHLAYNLSNSNKTHLLVDSICSAVGGVDNVKKAASGIFKVNLYLNDLESVSFNALSKLGAVRIAETKDGISMEFGSSSIIIARSINSQIEKLKRQ